MRYSYEFKRKCVEMYMRGEWPETPPNVSKREFKNTVRLWVRLEEANGPEVLQHKNQNRNWTPEDRLEIVMQVLAGQSIESVAIKSGIHKGMLYTWVRKYKEMGYNGLVSMKKGRQPKDPDMRKVGTKAPKPLNESEREELLRLRAENESMKAEIEVIKKEIALREEREAAQLKAKKQRSSKNSENKDTN